MTPNDLIELVRARVKLLSWSISSSSHYTATIATYTIHLKPSTCLIVRDGGSKFEIKNPSVKALHSEVETHVEQQKVYREQQLLNDFAEILVASVHS